MKMNKKIIQNQIPLFGSMTWRVFKVLLFLAALGSGWSSANWLKNQLPTQTVAETRRTPKEPQANELNRDKMVVNTDGVAPKPDVKPESSPEQKPPANSVVENKPVEPESKDAPASDPAVLEQVAYASADQLFNRSQETLKRLSEK